MAITPLTVTIDLNPSYKKIPAVYVSQLDNNLRSLAITVQDGGVNYDVASSGYDVYVEGTKPDKHGFSYKVTDIGGTVVGSVVTVPMQTQMTCVQGMVPTEIVLKSGADRIGSANFLLVVERAGLAEDVDVSETDIPAYIDGAQQAAAAAAQSADDAEDAKDLAVAAKDTAVSVAASIPEDYTTLSNDVDDLKSATSPITNEIDLSQYNREKCYVNANNIIANDGDKYSIFVPVEPNTTVKVTTSYLYGSVYAVLKTNTYTVGSAPDFATGFPSRILMTQNVEYTIDIPSDGHYIMIRTDMADFVSYFTVTAITPIRTYMLELEAKQDDIVDNVTIIETINISDYALKEMYINSAGTVLNGNHSLVLPVMSGEVYELQTSYVYGFNYALLKDIGWNVGSSATFCDGASLVSLRQNEKATISIPNDCRYMVIRCDSTPSDYSITKKADTYSINASQLRYAKNSNTVVVAASDSSEKDKAAADYVCTGTNDEQTIRAAVMTVLRSSAAITNGTEVVLMDGTYNIDAFPYTNDEGRHVAILLPSIGASDTIGSSTYSCVIKGAVYNAGGVNIVVSDTCYASLDSNETYAVFATNYDRYYNHFAFHDIRVHIPDAQKQIICIDGYMMGSLELRRCRCIVDNHAVWTTPIEDIVVPNMECIGVRGAAFDSNTWSYTWESVYCLGFGQGFAVSGEHLVMLKCVAIYGKYGYTFHRYYTQTALDDNTPSSHPITMIGCTDEANMNFWLFGDRNTRKPIINCYDLSIEWWTNWFGITGEGHYATEVTPGQFGGFISYAISGGNTATRWWAADGSGNAFRTINHNQKFAVTSAERTAYAPNMGQVVFDTTLNKPLICTNPATKEWRDMTGAIIS